HVVVRFLRRQRRQVIVDADALSELAQIAARQGFAQFRLTDEQRLQYQIFIGVEVRQYSKFFEHQQIQILRFVDDQQHAPPGGVLGDEEIAELLVQFGVALFLVGQAERERNPLHEPAEVFIRIGDEPDRRVAAELQQELPNQQRLARTHFAGQKKKSRLV